MAVSFLTTLNEEEFKIFLKQALTEIMDEQTAYSKPDIPDILDMKQAANFLRLQVSTLYEKTSQKTIPHFKKGNKLYFNKGELQAWVQGGKVKTNEELQGQASSYTMHKQTLKNNQLNKSNN
ncbi:MAG: helix-turn-helix domain-containing protein [Bacteroidia bacterium]